MPRYIQFDPTASFTTNTVAPVTNASDVSLYLPFDSDINDASANGHSGTASGSATISNTQAKFGSYSLSLNGTSQYVTFANNADFQFGSGDFTIEMFIYMTSNAGSSAGDRHALVARRASSSNRSFHIGIQLDSSQQKLQFSHSTSGSGGSQTNYDTDIQLNTWTHIAIVRSASKVFAFVDGVKNSSSHSIGSDTIYAGTSDLTIGFRGESSQYFPGFIDDLRITKGLALYQTSFVPPSQAVGASLSGDNETNSTTGFTSLYLPFDSSITADGSPINHSITANGGVNISSTQAKFGSNSAAFDGSDDQLTFTYNTGQYFGTGDFTVECFVYISAYSSGYWPIIYLGGPGATGNYQPSFGLGFETSGGKLRSIVGGTYIDHNAVTINTGQWIHVVACRAGGVYRTFIDGQLHGSTANTSNVSAGSNNSAIGGANFGGGAGTFYGANGYIDDVRVLKGFAKYTSEFTPPTTAVTATVSQTRNDLAVLYMPFNDGLEDKARNNAVTANGNAAISATQAKFGGKSLFIDATGDYLTVESNGAFKFGTNDFSISMFIRPDTISTSASAGSYAAILDYDASTLNGAHFTLHQQNQALVWVVQSAIGLTTSNCLSANTWHHVAVVRSSGTTSIIVDGNSVGSFSDAQNYNDTVTRSLYIGKQNIPNVRRFDGYIDDLLIVNGLAQSFSAAPTAASGGKVLTTSADTRTYASVFSLRSQYTEKAAGNWPGLPPVTVTVQVFGAGGAGGAQNAGGDGGNGGIVKASKALAPGTVLKIVVGNGGVGWAQANTGLLQGNTSDPMRGGDIYADVQNQTGGQGGSGSGVFVTSVTHGNAQVVAGGGGGGAGNASGDGGDSHSGTSASSSLNASDNSTGDNNYRGRYATTSAGGETGGSGSGPGLALLGGYSGTSSSTASSPYNSGGSGGGGYYGGSGAGHGNSASQQGGGGAGSGYVDSSWTRLSASGMTPKAGSSNANDNPADGADGAIIVTDGAGTTTYSTPGTYDHTVS